SRRRRSPDVAELFRRRGPEHGRRRRSDLSRRERSAVPRPASRMVGRRDGVQGPYRCRREGASLARTRDGNRRGARRLPRSRRNALPARSNYGGAGARAPPASCQDEEGTAVKTFIKEGEFVDVTAPSGGMTSGVAYLFGAGLFGVAQKTCLVGEANVI